jgi:hypothetical protein
LQDARRFAIGFVLDDVRALLSRRDIAQSTIQDVIRDQYRRVNQPEMPYSVAIAQNLRSLWKAIFPDVPL